MKVASLPFTIILTPCYSIRICMVHTYSLTHININISAHVDISYFRSLSEVLSELCIDNVNNFNYVT